MPPPHPDLISVIVVNWNRCELLRACLLSLRAQTVSHEVIVVDNGSSDGSVEMIRREFAATRLVENPGNRGFCAANNQGIAAARGAWIALLNNDAEAGPEWLAQLRRAFDVAPDAGMAASKILVWEDSRIIDKAGHLIYLDGQNRGRGSGEVDHGQYDLEEEVLWPDGCACMYRREMLDQIGGFDEDFFAYADDAELGLRARIAGWTCWYMPRAEVRHHRGATLGVASAQRIELIERNRVLLAARHFPWSLLWLNGAYYLARIAAGMRAGARNKGEVRRFPGWKGKCTLAWTLLKADCKAMLLVPKMLRKRSRTNTLRRLSPSQVKSLLIRFRIPLRQLMEQAI